MLSAYSVDSRSVAEARLTEYVDNGGIVILEEPKQTGDDRFGVEGVVRAVSRLFPIGRGSGGC